MPCLKTEISTCKTAYFFGKVMIYVKKKKNLKCVFTINAHWSVVKLIVVFIVEESIQPKKWNAPYQISSHSSLSKWV